MHKSGRSITIVRRTFFVSYWRNISSGTFSVSLFSGIENFYAYHDFLSNEVCPRVPNNFFGEISSVSKSSWNWHFWCMRGEYHDFPSQSFCPTVIKKLVAGLFCVSKNLWYWKILRLKEGAGGIITTFRREFVVLQYQNVVEEAFRVFENFWYRKMLKIGEGCGNQDFSRIFYSHSTEKNSYVNPSVFKRFSGFERIHA